MYGEYGHMEEGELGKPYDLRLLRRFASYAFPYKRPVLIALFLSILITLFDLAFPYLTKIAIDRYIVSSWYLVDLTGGDTNEIRQFRTRYAHLLKKCTQPSLYTISRQGLKKMDPAALHTYETHGIIRPQRFYRVPPDIRSGPGAHLGDKAFCKLADGSVLIPYEEIDSLSHEEILKIRGRDLRGVALIGGILFGSLLLSFGLSYFEYYLLEFAGQHVMQDIRLQLFRKIQSQAVRFFDRNPVGRLVTRVTNDIENLNEMFKSVIVTVFKDVFLVTGILAVLLYLNWHLALICFAVIPFIFGLTFLFSTMAREAFRELRSAVAKINAFLQERIVAMRIIQLFVRETIQMKTFARINHENYLAGMRQIRIFSVFMPIMELFSSFVVALILWYGGGRVIQEQLSLGSLVAFISYIQMFFKPIRDISEKYNIMQSAMASAERIFEFMDHKEEIPEPRHPSTPSEVKGHLVFKQVSFAYERGHPVLRDISFEVRPGETVAIVGATGSGKTTLISLAERFYDPDRGAVFLDGVDLRDWPKGVLRTNLGLCMQDVFIFGGNLGENISLGREDIGASAVELAARNANALAFIRRLPHGLQQDLSEGGATLSLGERQLLSFSRALAGNPKLLILDEATSSVDPDTERLIQETVSEMATRRTTLIVAHRLSTIEKATRILVIHKGRLVERGTHPELLALKGIYYRLSRLREYHPQDPPL